MGERKIQNVMSEPGRRELVRKVHLPRVVPSAAAVGAVSVGIPTRGPLVITRPTALGGFSLLLLYALRRECRDGLQIAPESAPVLKQAGCGVVNDRRGGGEQPAL